MLDVSKKRKNYTSEQKLTIVKSHLIGKEAVSEICHNHGISPSMFYNWQTTLFEHGARCFDTSKTGKQTTQSSRQVQILEAELTKTKAKLTEKHEVLSELMSEHMKLKKNFGD